MMFSEGTKGFRLILASLTAVLLCGCMKVGPEYVRPQTSVSREWIETHDTRVNTEPAEYRAWWEVFNDPVLDRLIDRAYCENLSLKIAGVRVLEARAQLGIAVGSLYPQRQQAAGSTTFTRSSERSSSALSQAVIDFNSWQD